MRGVVLAGGYGTRMAPCTKVTNKHLLPVYSKGGAVPMIHYPIYTLVDSGVENILIISSRQHSGDIIEHLGDGNDFGADFSYKVQDMDRVQLGIASALQIARGYTQDEDIAVILGDNYFSQSYSRRFQKFEQGDDIQSHIFVQVVDDPSRFGVLKWEGDQILSIVEKPKQPPSKDAVTGLYLFKPGVYDVAEKLVPSARGELEIVDILNYYIPKGRLDYSRIDMTFWSDMGTPESMQRTQEFINGR